MAIDWQRIKDICPGAWYALAPDGDEVECEVARCDADAIGARLLELADSNDVLRSDKNRLMLDNASWQSTCDRLTEERDAALKVLAEDVSWHRNALGQRLVELCPEHIQLEVARVLKRRG